MHFKVIITCILIAFCETLYTKISKTKAKRMWSDFWKKQPSYTIKTERGIKCEKAFQDFDVFVWKKKNN